jgi:hypothetical protein
MCGCVAAAREENASQTAEVLDESRASRRAYSGSESDGRCYDVSSWRAVGGAEKGVGRRRRRAEGRLGAVISSCATRIALGFAIFMQSTLGGFRVGRVFCLIGAKLGTWIVSCCGADGWRCETGLVVLPSIPSAFSKLEKSAVSFCGTDG